MTERLCRAYATGGSCSRAACGACRGRAAESANICARTSVDQLANPQRTAQQFASVAKIAGRRAKWRLRLGSCLQSRQLAGNSSPRVREYAGARRRSRRLPAFACSRSSTLSNACQLSQRAHQPAQRTRRRIEFVGRRTSKPANSRTGAHQDTSNMSLIKRILRRTSHKLLNKLGAPHASRRLILSSSSANIMPATGESNLMGRASRSKKISKKAMRASASTCLSDALLHAARNSLPPVQFHHVHGPNVQLSANKLIARRTQGFCQALVFSNRVILPNERVYIKVLEIAKGWSGTIRFGFTSVDPATLRYQMPKHACPDMTNAGHTWARALADEVVRRNSVIHLSYNTNGYIHYGINNQDCGIFYANVNTSQNLWFIVDIYGLTAAVELIDPRIHNASRELDFSRIDEELRLSGQLTPAALPSSKPDHVSSMDHFQAFDPSAIVRLAGKKKRSRKSSRNRLPTASSSPSTGLIYEPWLAGAQSELIRNEPMNLDLTHLPASAIRQAQFLPNLNSIALPSAQQNIYSPMPTNQLADRSAALATARNINDTHDYHQIMTNSLQSPTTSKILNSNTPAQRRKICSTAEVRSRAGELGGVANTSRAPATPARGRNVIAFRPATTTDAHDDELQICREMSGLHFDSSNTGHNQQHTASKYTKSTQAFVSATTPAMTGRALRQQQSTTLSKRMTVDTGGAHRETKTKTGLSDKFVHATTASHHNQQKVPKATSASLNSGKNRSRLQCTKVQQSKISTSGDSNSSPPSRDCPICFERPINCVLYQCGHMCTCYECGVKQWKTQSRTCPICRTVIKDVIKTYLS